MSAPLDIRELVAMLAARVDKLAAELLPRGRKEGPEWVEASTAAGGLGDSLKVHLTGAKAGVWSHFAAGRSGDALDLVAYMLFADDKKRAVAWSRRWLGLDHADPAAIARIQRQAAKVAAQSQAAAEAAEKRMRGWAQALWLKAEPKIIGTPAELYLAGRGIDLAALDHDPGALRYAPALYNSESDRHWPALVAGVVGPGGHFMAVHRTWLEVRRDGRVTKAPLAQPKMALGNFKGGWIVLWRGRRPDGRRAPPLARAPAGTWVSVSEGIEDGLSVAVIDERRRIISSLSLGNMANLQLPEAVIGLEFLRQNDPPGSKAAKLLDKVIAAQLRRRLKVKAPRPPAGIKDWNALLTRGEEGAA